MVLRAARATLSEVAKTSDQVTKYMAKPTQSDRGSRHWQAKLRRAWVVGKRDRRCKANRRALTQGHGLRRGVCQVLVKIWPLDWVRISRQETSCAGRGERRQLQTRTCVSEISSTALPGPIYWRAPAAQTLPRAPARTPPSRRSVLQEHRLRSE